MNKNLKKNNNLEVSKPSNWIKNNLKSNINDLTLLDIACGSGRHSIYAASKGYKVISLDISKEKILKLTSNKLIYPIQLDIEASKAWPFINKTFDTVIVTNYLYRPIFKNIINSIKLGGTLLYETFSIENSTFGKPNNPNYLLKPQELLNLAKKNNMKIINYEEIITQYPIKKALQRIHAKIR
jgi:SAM-dependent methyltransferase